MKHTLLLTLICTLILAGCSQEETTTTPVLDSASQTPTVESVLEQGTQEEIPAVTEEPEVTPTVVPEGYGSYGITDIDLTRLSSTMVYTQVYNMVMTPSDFSGMSMKMNGMFAYYYDELWDEYYYAVIIMDATACCAQGIEFALADADERTFPDDYPQAGEEITVVGVYNQFYSEEYPDWEYYRLEQAEFITES